MSSGRFIFAAALVLAAPGHAAAQAGWTPYAVPEAGLRIDLPTQIFSNDAGAVEGGVGRKFTTPDGRATLTVQSLPNDRGDTPAAFLAKKNPPPGIVYRRVTDRFFVVSSYRNNIIFYNRCNFIDRSAHCVLINYPAREKRQWDRIVTRLSLSLR